MGWWFGRKSAPADARPFVPAWLTTTSQVEGFARTFEGVSALIKSTTTCATFVAGVWELGIVRAAKVVIAGQQVVSGRLAAIASSSGGTIVDTQARSTLDQILTAMRQHGLIET
ncbi:MAG: hypothetical protein ABI770_04935 [Sphingomicrobium sp.]